MNARVTVYAEIESAEDFLKLMTRWLAVASATNVEEAEKTIAAIKGFVQGIEKKEEVAP